MASAIRMTQSITATASTPFPSSAYFTAAKGKVDAAKSNSQKNNPAASNAESNGKLRGLEDHGFGTAPSEIPKNFRDWHTTENWCALCQEPFGQWNEHRGKRDHLCLEMFFDAVVDHQRHWGPEAVWASFATHFKKLTMERLFAGHDGSERDRRAEIFLLLHRLVDEKVVFLGPTKWRDPAIQCLGIGQQGSLLMYRWFHPHILTVFPRADAKQVSSFSQMCASMYNLETVFDLCGLKDLIRPGDMPTTPQGDVAPLEYSTKSYIIRNLFGQLRWVLERDSQHPPAHNIIATSCPPHLALIAEHVTQALIAETIFCRVCEYVCRAEPVWRSMGSVTQPDRLYLEGPPPQWEQTARSVVQNEFHRGVQGMLAHNGGTTSHTYKHLGGPPLQ